MKTMALAAVAGLGVAAGVIALNPSNARPRRDITPLVEDLRSKAVTAECLSSQKSADALSMAMGRGIGPKVASSIAARAEGCRSGPDENICIALATHLLVEHALHMTSPGLSKVSYYFNYIQAPRVNDALDALSGSSDYTIQASVGIEAMRNACKK